MPITISPFARQKLLKVSDLKPGETYELVGFDEDNKSKNWTTHWVVGDWFIMSESKHLVNLRNGADITNTGWCGNFLPVNLTVSRTV